MSTDQVDIRQWASQLVEIANSIDLVSLVEATAEKYDDDLCRNVGNVARLVGYAQSAESLADSPTVTISGKEHKIKHFRADRADVTNDEEDV